MDIACAAVLLAPSRGFPKLPNTVPVRPVDTHRHSVRPTTPPSGHRRPQMSAPLLYEKGANHIRYGFLAARSRTAIDKLLNNQTPSEEDLQCLAKTSVFIEELLNGTALLTTGKYQGYNSRETLNALNMVMNPLVQLQSLVNQKMELTDFFSRLKSSLDTLVHDPKPITSLETKQLLNFAAIFFDFLYTSLAETIGESRRANVFIHSRQS